MAYTCYIIELPFEGLYAKFDKEYYDVESKDAIIVNSLNTNHDGAIAYSVKKTDGTSAEDIATIDENGRLVIKNGAVGHLIVTANISGTESFEALQISYNVDVYRIYKAGEELDVEKQDYDGYYRALYSPYWMLSNYNADNVSVRCYKIPKSMWNKKNGWVINGAIEKFPNSDRAVCRATNFKATTSSLNGDTTEDGTICNALDIVSTQQSGYGPTYKHFSESGTNEGKFVYYPSENYVDFKQMYMYIEAPTASFQGAGIFLTLKEDFKDYGD